jgi:ADP-ribosylglycohydrolase
MPAGTVTDDTEQAVLLARLLVKGHGTINPHELATALTEWEQDMAERGSLDLLGPSTKRAVAAILAGTPPEEAGTAGTTNGAAMRIAPVGIAVPLDPPPPLGPAPPLDPAPPLGPAPPLDPAPPLGPAPPPSQVDLSTLVDRVVAASRVTHNTGIALAGAAAVAAAVSAGVSGATIAEATALGIEAAHIAAARGHWVAGADVAARIEWATGLVAGRAEAEAAELIYTLAGTSLATQESVPAAFAVLAAVPEDPWRAARLAAALGGGGGTGAALAAAMSGACHGAGSFPSEAIAVIDAQGLGLAALAGELLALRGRPGGLVR